MNFQGDPSPASYSEPVHNPYPIRTNSNPPSSFASPDAPEHSSAEYVGPVRQPLPDSRAITKTKKGKSSLSARGSYFSQAEVDHSLGILNRLLPLCKEDWDMFINEHSKLFPLENRTFDSLRRKFAGLHHKRISTGDPLMPADVRRAKQLRHKVTERTDMGVVEDTPGEYFLPPDRSPEHAEIPHPNISAIRRITVYGFRHFGHWRQRAYWKLDEKPFSSLSFLSFAVFTQAGREETTNSATVGGSKATRTLDGSHQDDVCTKSEQIK